MKYSGVIDGANVEFSASDDGDGSVERVFARMASITAHAEASSVDTKAEALQAARTARSEGFSDALSTVSKSMCAKLTALASADAGAALAIVGVGVETTVAACEKSGIAPRTTEREKAEVTILGVVNAALKLAGAPLIVADLVQRGEAKGVQFRVKGPE